LLQGDVISGAWNRINAASMPGMATQNSTASQITAFCQAMDVDGLLSVLGAGRIEAAARSNKQTQCTLVNAYQAYDDFTQHFERVRACGRRF